jgi:hypothetical protein
MPVICPTGQVLFAPGNPPSNVALLSEQAMALILLIAREIAQTPYPLFESIDLEHKRIS